MATKVLCAGCPVCGQNLRSWTWIETLESRPISIAHEARLGQGSIERRELALGEKCSPEALVLAGEDERGKSVYEPAGGKSVPDWWPDMLKRQMVRAATALGLCVTEASDDRLESLGDRSLTDRQFHLLTSEFINEAEAELDFRKREVARAKAARRK